jgi:hypothetical protein
MPAWPEDKPRKMGWTAGAFGPTLLSALRRALLIAGLGLSATLSACAGAPEHPTYDEDIRPLLVARCVRCHTDPGQVDPLSAKAGVDEVAAPSFDYPYYGDLMNAGAANAYSKMLAKYARGPVGPIPRMPPVPAAPLEDWEITMLENWGKDPR